MFQGEYADMCAEKFPLTWMGGQAEGLLEQTRERGPPSAWAEIYKFNTLNVATPAQDRTTTEFCQYLFPHWEASLHSIAVFPE